MSGNILEVNEAGFEQNVINSSVPVLVDFWAPWCGPCRMMAPVLESLSEKVSPMKLMKINTDENQSLASQYNVQGIPCLIVFKNGAESERFVGFLSEAALMDKLEPYIK